MTFEEKMRRAHGGDEIPRPKEPGRTKVWRAIVWLGLIGLMALMAAIVLGSIQQWEAGLR